MTYTQLQFDDVEVSEQSCVFSDFFKVDKFIIRHKMFDGQCTGPLTRLVMERGDAVVVLPYDPNTDEVVLIEQFRIGAFAEAARSDNKSSPWLLECIAGMIDKVELPQEVAVRESEEEAGIEISHLKQMMAVYTSPGGISEKLYLYAALVDSTTAHGVHGLDHEHEDIRVHRVAFEEAIKLVETGRINNAPTVLALQWLQLNKTKWLDSLGC